MDIISSFDADCSAFAGLFQSIMNDLKNSGPMWEDFISKTSRLHHALKTVLVSFSSFLDAFQRIADAATNARGATKDVGAALTRLSLRHRAIESKVKALTCSLLECLVNPLQEKLEDWKRVTFSLDKQHTKEYKRCRADIKKRTESSARLHKKVKKAGRTPELNKVVNSSMSDLSSRLSALQESEKSAVRGALTEERARFCTFASALKPVLIEEVGLVSELGHLQEVIVQLEKHSADPRSLPSASEQVLEDAKAGENRWTWQTPPSSPTSSLGSRKSSMCSISSINSSSSSSTQSPAHRPLSSSQGHRLVSVCSKDSGFISQDTLYRTRRPCHFLKTSGLSDTSAASDDSRTPPPAAQSTATWPNLTDPTLQHKSVSTSGLHDLTDRPHTISTAYERGKDRTPLTVYTFQPPEAYKGQMSPQISSQPVSPVCLEKEESASAPFSGHTATISRRSSRSSLQQNVSSSSQESIGQTSKPRPPIPSRCASLERPDRPEKTAKQRHAAAKNRKIIEESKSIDRNFAMPDFNMAAPDMILPQPLYSNMEELAATGKVCRLEGDMSSLTSSGYGSQPNMVEPGYRSDIEGGWHMPMRPHSLAVLPHSVFHSQLINRTGPNSPRCGSLRRGQKPPPPIRRTSSITSTSSLALASNSGRQTCAISSPISLKDAYFSPVDQYPLMRSCSLQTGSGSNTPTPVGSIENFPPPPAYLLDSSDGPTAGSVAPEHISEDSKPKLIQDDCLRNRTSSVSETIKSLQDNHHMPPSPISIRRAQSLINTNPLSVLHGGHVQREERRQSLNARAALITSLNARLSQSPPRTQAVASVPHRQSIPMQRTASSPKLQRMRLTSVQEAMPGDMQQAFRQNQTSSFIACEPVGGRFSQRPVPLQCDNEVDSRSGKTGNHQFLQNLNMVLAHRSSPNEHHSPSNSNPGSPKSKTRRRNQQCSSGAGLRRAGGSASDRASKMRQWIANKTVKNTESIRESLLDQIRRGTPLRRVLHVADRSAPRV